MTCDNAKPVPLPAATVLSATAGALLRRAMSIYRRHFWAFFSVTLVALCLLMLCVGAVFGIGQLKLPSRVSPMNLRDLLMFGGVLIGLAVYSVAYVACKGTIALIVAALLSGRRASAPEAFVALVPVMLRLLGVLILLILLYLGASFVPLASVLVPAFFCLVVPVAALEGRRPFAAVSRGLSLMFRSRPVGHPRGEATNTGRSVLLSLAMIPAMIAVYVPVCAGAMFMAAARPAANDAPAAIVIMLGATGAVAALIYPVFAIADALLYFEIRRRYEGFDVETLKESTAEEKEGDEVGPSPPSDPPSSLP